MSIFDKPENKNMDLYVFEDANARSRNDFNFQGYHTISKFEIVLFKAILDQKLHSFYILSCLL